MKIAIDCRMLGGNGIGVYLENILLYWLNDTNTRFVLIGDKAKINALPVTNKCTIIECDIKPFSFKEIIGFPTNEVNKCDVFYTPNFNIPFGIKVPIYSTIHDVVFLDIKNLTNRLGYYVRKFYIWRAFKISKKIFTVSEFSKERITHFFGNKKPVIVAYNGIRADLLKCSTFNAPKYNFPYLIFVGNLKKHKGIDILLKAVENTDAKLVVVGASANMRTVDNQVIKMLKNNKNVILEGQVDNQSLFSLIANAKVLVQPSRYEGFGIPPLEALFLGTNAIVSDIPVFKEVYGELPVTFFIDGNAVDLQNKILNLQTKKIQRDLLTDAFSYERTSEIIISQITND